MVHLECRVVDEDVYLAELVDGGVDDVPAVLRVGDLAVDEYGAAAGLLDVLRGVLGILVPSR
jgi:hypothetical protein